MWCTGLFLAFTIHFLQGFVPSQATTQAEQRYLFYLHGRIVEDRGADAFSERFGRYEYRQILDTFRAQGFVVKSELRPSGTDADAYANKLVAQLQWLLNNGVSPQRITIVGAPKGAVVAMLTSTRLQNPDVSFVLLANCNNWVSTHFNIKLCGRILSIFEASDKIGGSCEKRFAQATGTSETAEIELTTGRGHGFIFSPLPAWVEPTVEWAHH